MKLLCVSSWIKRLSFLERNIAVEFFKMFVTLSTTSRVPCGSIICERKWTSLKQISLKLSNLAPQIWEKIHIFDFGLNCPFKTRIMDSVCSVSESIENENSHWLSGEKRHNHPIICFCERITCDYTFIILILVGSVSAQRDWFAKAVYLRRSALIMVVKEVNVNYKSCKEATGNG